MYYISKMSRQWNSLSLNEIAYIASFLTIQDHQLGLALVNRLAHRACPVRHSWPRRMRLPVHSVGLAQQLWNRGCRDVEELDIGACWNGVNEDSVRETMDTATVVIEEAKQAVRVWSGTLQSLITHDLSYWQCTCNVVSVSRQSVEDWIQL